MYIELVKDAGRVLPQKHDRTGHQLSGIRDWIDRFVHKLNQMRKCDVAEPGQGILEMKVLGVLPCRGTSPIRKRPSP